MQAKMDLNIVVDRDRYHLIRVMEQWCEQQLGPGKWSYAPVNLWEGLPRIAWSMCSTFGRTTFSFKHEHDYEWFILRWGNDDDDDRS